MRKIIRAISLIVVVSLLSACGDSGSGVPSDAPSASLGGTVTDAVITNGTLRVYKFDDGTRGELIAETVTDGNGDFEIADFASQDRPVVIEVSGGRYTEEASGVSVDLLDGQVLRAYLFYEQGSAITLQVTPFTHMASCLADYKISTGVNVNNAITESTSVFSGLAGIDILGTKPLDITNPINANFEVTDSLRYGAVLAAISSFTAEVSETNGVTPHRFNQNSSIYATQVLCQDIAADGVFNGLGFINNGNSVGQLSLGSVPLDVNTLRSKVAQHILSIISSDRNQTNLGVEDFVLYANEIASSTDGVFGGVPATAVDQNGPTVTAVLAPDSFLKGIVNLNFVVSDPIGIKSVQFEVNDVLHSNGQVDAPIMSLNSTNYTDGVLKITVVATDILNNVSNVDFNYVVDNTSPIISLTSAVLVNNKNYTATGAYEEQGAPVASIKVNGIDASIDANTLTWSADVVLLSGDNVVTLDIVDTAVNTNTVDINVGVDLVFPTISPNNTQVRFTTFQGQLNLCNIGNLNPSIAINNPVCLSTDSVSLNGTALNGDIQFSGFTLLGFTATDPQGAGVFTGQTEIVVEYKYEVNGVEFLSWGTAPKSTNSANNSLIYYFPMVTEYLGASWFQTTTDDVHKVTFRVTDSAGNSNQLSYDIQFDILVPEIAVNAVINDSLFSSTSFANRTAIDGTAIDVFFTFDNVNNAPILFSLDDAALHEVNHTYELGIRENQARIVTTQQSRFDFGGGYVVTTNVYDGNYNLIPNINSITNASYQPIFTDSPSPLVASEWALVSQSIKCNYIHRSRSSPTRWFGFFDRPLMVVPSGGINPINAASFSGNGFTSASTCQNGAIGSLNWQKRNKYSYQNQSGFPRNNINDVVVNNNVNTESLTVTNTTLGQTILSINGWYSVPAGHSVSIKKTTRMPVLAHFYDNELANTGSFSSYTEKKLDKTTTWKIDTDLVFSHVINPGNINNVNSVTPTVSNVGNGVYTKTISR